MFGKQPWELTRAEVVRWHGIQQALLDRAVGRPVQNAYPMDSLTARDLKIHRKLVKQAIRDGKIAAHADYPELTPVKRKKP
jgi:hypothetical protein